MTLPKIADAYTLTTAAIDELEAQCAEIVVKDGKDVAGFQVARSARLAVRSKRTEVERTRVALKKDSLEYGRAVDAEARRITHRLEPIEARLKGLEQLVLDERARVEAEEAERARAELERRMGLFEALGAVAPVGLATMSEEEIDASLAIARDQKKQRDEEAAKAAAEAKRAEEERLKEQARIRKVEEAKAKAREKEQAEARAKQAQEDARLRKEREELEASKEAARLERQAIEKRESEERAAIAAEREALRKAKEELEAERATKEAEEAAAKAEATRPSPPESGAVSAPKWTPSADQVSAIASEIPLRVLDAIGLIEAQTMSGAGREPWILRMIVEAVWSESPGPQLYEALEHEHRLVSLFLEGWSVQKASFYDEEGLEGWCWTSPDASQEIDEVGNWDESPPLPDPFPVLVRPSAVLARARGEEVGS